MPDSLGNLINKVKEVTKQAVDGTARQAKLARLRLNLMTLHTERNRHLQNIGGSLFASYKQNKTFDQAWLYAELQNEFSAVEQLDRQADAIEVQIRAHEVEAVEVKDVTED